MDMIKNGRLIAARRKELGMTQEELGRLLDVTAKAVSKWERGLSYPDVTLISRLAAALHLSVIEMLSGENHQQSGSQCYTASSKADEQDGFCRNVRPLNIRLDDTPRTLVSPFLFGENLEHTRSDIFMGLSAQMLRNRKFAGKPLACRGYSMEWYPIGERIFYCHSEAYTQHAEEFYHMKRQLERNAQSIVSTYGGEAGIGQHELTLLAGSIYEFRIVAKALKPMQLHVALTSRGGAKEYASEDLLIGCGGWNTYELRLASCAEDRDGDLRITFCGENTLHIGAVSLMPAGHFRGMRRDVIEKLREMGITLLRWPGGNFAGEYCWADGLLPSDMRAPLESYLGLETQPRSMGYDYQEINTDDFIALCREIGAEPFITINPAWNSPEENAAWVEYCNGGTDTKYGALRAQRGYPEPYHVQFWSLGNEMGYGHMEGDNTPYGYSKIARQNAVKMLEASGQLSLCSSGPYPSRDWSDHAANPLSDISRMVSLHYYAPWVSYADPAKLEEEYYRCVSAVETARAKIHELRAQLNDSLKISFDEWNTWYAWYRPSSIVDGVFTALMLHMFIEEAERNGIALVCHFEAVNEGMMEVYADHTVLTAAGQAFAMMKHHAGGRLLYASTEAAVTEKDGMLTVTAVNPSYDKPRTVTIPAGGETVQASLYSCGQVAPHTHFEIKELSPLHSGDGSTVELPPHSLLLMKMKAK